MAEDDRFFVKTLRMQNFRCFEDVELGPFDPHFNLLIGENGAGKSSVLGALANLLRPLAARGGVLMSNALLSATDNRAYREFDPHSGSRRASAEWSLTAELQVPSQSIYVSESFQSQSSIEHQPKVAEDLRGGRLKRSLLGGFSAQAFAQEPRLIVLHRVDRRFRDGNRELPTLASVLPATAYSNWADAGASGVELREWMRDETLVALQANNAKDFADSTLKTWLDLISDALTAFFDPAVTISYDGISKDMVLEGEDRSFQPFSSLSDGQRALAGLVTDLARRCFLLNGKRTGGNPLETTSGVVLIDEIDLHLHPKWQRQIVPALKKVFPRIQFFATTHSPQVIGEAQPHEIVLLTSRGQERPAGSFGMDSNWILECVMQAVDRNANIASRIKSLFDLIDEDKLNEAKIEIKRLRQELPAVAPEIVSAEAYIWNLEHGADEAAE